MAKEKSQLSKMAKKFLKIFSKKFQKTLDKSMKVWYNKGTKDKEVPSYDGMGSYGKLRRIGGNRSRMVGKSSGITA